MRSCPLMLLSRLVLLVRGNVQVIVCPSSKGRCYSYYYSKTSRFVAPDYKLTGPSPDCVLSDQPLYQTVPPSKGFAFLSIRVDIFVYKEHKFVFLGLM